MLSRGERGQPVQGTQRNSTQQSVDFRGQHEYKKEAMLGGVLSELAKLIKHVGGDITLMQWGIPENYD